MPIIVIGGHTRNIGKTSVVAGLIAALPHLNWTAIKITQFGHNVCSANGEPCDCQTADHTLAISEERDPTTGTDTSRFLAAGAKRVFWVRTRQGQLAEAMPRVRTLIADAENTILESNSVLRFLQPDISLAVLDPTIADFKPSALRYLDRTDALILPAGATLESLTQAWPGVSPQLLAHKPLFHTTPPTYASPDLIHFVSTRLDEVRAANREREALPPCRRPSHGP
jgi:molybdopterin-guanine dinucleotide biosynthesis protein